MTLVDPAVGTGTFLLTALRSIAETVAVEEGPGAVAGRIEDALQRLIGFEIQLGPFAVGQLRLLAELADLGVTTSSQLRMYVTDTLADPYIEDEALGSIYEPIAQSRRLANEIKKNQPVLVVIGNPPYKEKAKGRGGWVEAGNPNTRVAAPLAEWVPPPSWGVSAHVKHLRNLYVYFWRRATWKVFDHEPQDESGIVCFITVAGFLNGPGFQKMRDYLRRTVDELWGHRLLTGRSSARSRHADLPGRPAADLHRHGVALARFGGEHPGRRALPLPSARAPERQVRRARPGRHRRRRLDRVPDRVA